ncbi:MAG: S9 family peptidase [Gemmatimonadetes bacterium]|nr:S9 family peptidase [Gemmatimonadota bacterium]
MRRLLLAAALGGTGAVALLAQESSLPVLADRVTAVGSLLAGEGPIWAPDGQRIYFGSSLGGIWSVPAGGGTATRVAREVATGLVRLSPSGGQFAYLSDKSGNPEIWLWTVADASERRLTDLGARINAFSWSPDGRTIALSALLFGQFDVYLVEVASGRARRLTSDPRFETSPAWAPDGRTLYYWRSDDRWADHDLMAISVTGGESRLVASDRDLFDYGTIGTRSKMGYPLVSPDGKQVLFKSHRSGWINVGRAPPGGGGAARPLAAEAADQSDARWSPDGSRVAFASIDDGTQRIVIAPVAGGTAIRLDHPTAVTQSRGVASDGSGGARHGLASAPEWSPDGSKLAYLFGTPTAPNDLFVAPAPAAGTAPAPIRLTQSIDPAIERTMVVPEKIRYQSDQLSISGYLFRPPAGTPGQPYPGVMYIHGGPTSQFADSYLPQAQFLARAGYLVLAPNIRGSSGYGKAFEDANNPCWTHCDLRDVVAGVEYLKKLPGVDTANMGITGNSYGGIMSMGAVAHAPGVFRAAAPQSGYANWISFQDYNTELQHSKLNAYEWGPYPDSAAVYRRNSAIFSAHRVTTPVLLIQGAGLDQVWRPGVYPITASLEFAHALDRLNKVVQLKTYPGESYYVTGRENSRQVLLDIAEFFDRHLRGDHRRR